MRGTKTAEYRSRPTRVQARIYIYASLHRDPAADESQMTKELGFDVARLPRGLLIGTVELWGCLGDGSDDYKWLLRAPERLVAPLRPKSRANPVWSWPLAAS